MSRYTLENRRFVIGGVAVAIVTVYIIRLFTLQLMSDDYKKNADSNAFLKRLSFRRVEQYTIATVSCWCTTSPHTTLWL